MKRVLKFATGQPIPEGAVYLSTITNGEIPDTYSKDYVWHYFLVEEE